MEKASVCYTADRCPSTYIRRVTMPNGAAKYILKRLAIMVITMILVSFITYAAFAFISGDPAQTMLGTNATPQRVEQLREEMGLNRPFLVRYGSWLAGFVTGDLGVSYNYHQPVWELVEPKIEITLLLCLISFIMIAALSIPLGLHASQTAEKKTGWIGTIGRQICMAVPPFFIGILVSYLFGIVLRLFQPTGFPDLHRDFLGAVKHLFFAAICLAIPRIAMTVRMLRSTVIGEMQKDYVRTAISRGNDRPAVLSRHVLKNALVPTITFLGQTMAELVAGGIVIEQVFGIPGLGRFLVQSISNRDYPVVQALVVILAFWVVLSGFAADLINQCIDPRLRRTGGQE